MDGEGVRAADWDATIADQAQIPSAGTVRLFKKNVRNIEINAIVRGDSLIPEISAASIIAKVERDRYMYELDIKYPQYNLKKHKGYPTKEHIELLKEHGVIDIYRKSFRPVKELI